MNAEQQALYDSLMAGKPVPAPAKEKKDPVPAPVVDEKETAPADVARNKGKGKGKPPPPPPPPPPPKEEEELPVLKPFEDAPDFAGVGGMDFLGQAQTDPVGVIGPHPVGTQKRLRSLKLQAPPEELYGPAGLGAQLAHEFMAPRKAEQARLYEAGIYDDAMSRGALLKVLPGTPQEKVQALNALIARAKAGDDLQRWDLDPALNIDDATFDQLKEALKQVGRGYSGKRYAPHEVDISAPIGLRKGDPTRIAQALASGVLGPYAVAAVDLYNKRPPEARLTDRPMTYRDYNLLDEGRPVAGKQKLQDLSDLYLKAPK